MIIIYGPTAVGKTEFSEKLAQRIKGEIINADVGQLYTPLTIGTAKPVWRLSDVPHHLFDYSDEPRDMTVVEYRNAVTSLLGSIRGLPLIVGGSGFYIDALLFPPKQVPNTSYEDRFVNKDTLSLWDELATIDRKRAEEINKKDRYRIKRALTIWYNTGTLPSVYKPSFNPPDCCTLLILERDRDDLYHRIDKRVIAMIDEGWIEEVRALQGTTWEPFLLKKKILGYDDIIRFLHHESSQRIPQLIDTIAKKTRNYAKRQITFGSFLRKKLTPYIDSIHYNIEMINLTLSDVDLYINQLVQKLVKEKRVYESNI